ncbi:hypothetical protein EMEDMD4_790345 [Sinorhizobium medicae]|uniref:Uncharacterized protein n=1 Tax=Sinorhizobium medicae TaxID=110321 RepID=A0A508X631_9HYPH|nr:hypothetical protein EMEDMD4_1330005 [Sinorhizobium medicae]VTZ65321.1 hypothetical protein EMEDMD4_790345 [Sinorhizobium medicae]
MQIATACASPVKTPKDRRVKAPEVQKVAAADIERLSRSLCRAREAYFDPRSLAIVTQVEQLS